MSLVADPITGIPSKQEVSYIAVERTQLEAEVTAAEEAQTVANDNVISLNEQLVKAQSDAAAKAAALEESKSLVSEWDSIAPTEAVVDAGATGDGSESETAVEESAEVTEEPVTNF